MKKKNKIILCVIFGILILFLFINNNIIDKRGIHGISYKVTYTNSKGSKWYRFNQKTKISENINSISLVNKKDGGESISYYSNGKWSIKSNDRIYAIRVSNSAKFLRTYIVCYRTYNDKNGWLNWTCSNYIDNTSGNKKYPIKAVQFKMIYRNSNLYDYLDDYYSNNNNINYGF